MEERDYHFCLPNAEKSIIKVIGVGGGGGNAVNHMYKQKIQDVEFIICNTDKQALLSSAVTNRLQIGSQITGGLGAGASPKKGEEAAKESKNEIVELLRDETRMLFITAGMGGGTGTGAAPIIAQIANDMGILTVGIVTLPFHWEGANKMKQAQEGVEKMKMYCDTVLVVLNEKLKEMYHDISVRNAFAKANDVLSTAAKGIAEIITVSGEVNVDFEDVNTVLRGAGDAVMGSAVASGEQRALKAIEHASTSPLLDNQHLHGAKKILLSIVCGDQPEMGMDELATITEYVQGKIGENAELIFGHGFDGGLGDKLAITLIATDFRKNIDSSAFATDNKKVYNLDVPQQQVTDTTTPDFSSTTMSMEDEQQPPMTYDWDVDINTAENGQTDTRFEIEENISIAKHNDHAVEEPLEELQGAAHPLKRKHTLVAEREERLRALSGVKEPNNFDAETFKDKIDRPAYLRRNISLPDVPPSVQRNLSRFYLDAEDKLLGKNRFLYDNVD